MVGKGARGGKRSFQWAALICVAVGFLTQDSIRVKNSLADADMIGVRLNLSARDDIFNNFGSCLKEELERFEDIRVDENGPKWELNIVASRAPVRGGVEQDYAVSLVVFSFPDEGAPIMEGHELMLGYPNLQSGCKDVAINFAEKYLQKNTQGFIRPF